MFKNRFLTGLLCIFTIIITLTFSIGLPIYFRPFYYMQIETLNLEERTGFDRETIIESYNEVLDYLTLPQKEFATGEFSYSEIGKRHFEDCKMLFNLNISFFVISVIVVIVLKILKRKKYFSFSRPFGQHFTFICGASTIIATSILTILVALDFKRAFKVFHKIFFYGKGAWILNPQNDQIVRALPTEFFMNCAILIMVSIFTISLGLVIYGLVKRNET